MDTSYVGWAPDSAARLRADAVGQQHYGSHGVLSGGSGGCALSSPLWVFARAASFLLGFGQPYYSAYSYGGCGCLAPPTFVPIFFNRAAVRPHLLYAELLPAVLFRRWVWGAYSYGPPANYISRVSNINQKVINDTINNNSANIDRIHNVMPPQAVLTRNAGLRQITPPALVQGQRLPPAQRLTNVNMARANLGKPNIMHAPKNVPPLTAQIPKAPPLAAQPVKGGSRVPRLPSKSTMQLTPQQQQQVQKLPPQQQIKPVKPPLAGQVKPSVQPGVQPGAKPGQVQPGVPGNLDRSSPERYSPELNPVRCNLGPSPAKYCPAAGSGQPGPLRVRSSLVQH